MTGLPLHTTTLKKTKRLPSNVKHMQRKFKQGLTTNKSAAANK